MNGNDLERRAWTIAGFVLLAVAIWIGPDGGSASGGDLAVLASLCLINGRLIGVESGRK
jgi:hypothetical protein